MDFTTSGTRTTGARDGLPLKHYGLSVEDRRRTLSLAFGMLPDSREADEWGRVCWKLSMAIGLNCLHGGVLQPPRECAHGHSSKVADEIWDHLSRISAELTADKDLIVSDFDPGDHLKSKGIDYAGDILTRPVTMTLKLIAPGLPPEGLGGSIDALELADGWLRAVLLDPALVIHPQSAWPDLTPTKTHALGVKSPRPFLGL